MTTYELKIQSEEPNEIKQCLMGPDYLLALCDIRDLFEERWKDSSAKRKYDNGDDPKESHAYITIVETIEYFQTRFFEILEERSINLEDAFVRKENG